MAMTAIPYVCTECGVTGVRLYRRYQTYAENAELKCRPCSEIEQADALARVRAAGLDRSPDQIGWRVAAVPADDGETFWGYTSVPDEDVAWWNALPDKAATGADG